MKHTGEFGPVYGVALIDTLPLGETGGMCQAMPSRADLEQVAKRNARVAAGYEILLGHYKTLLENITVEHDKCLDLAQAVQRLSGEVMDRADVLRTGWRTAGRLDLGRLGRFCDRPGDDWSYGKLSRISDGVFRMVTEDGGDDEPFYICEVEA